MSNDCLGKEEALRCVLDFRVQLAQEAVFVTTSFQCKLNEWTLLLVPQGAS